MADKPEAGRLLISQSPGSTRIEGIVGADPNLMALVGTVKEAALIEIDDASKLERAIVEATQSGTRVMDGYVKFAYPIVIKGPTQVTVGDAWLAKKASELVDGLKKSASDAQYTTRPDSGVVVSDLGLYDFISKVAHMTPGDTGGIEKLAACDFVENWLRKIELDKVEGKEVGLNVPVKVAFSDDKAKEWFLSLFPKKAARKSAAETLAERLVAIGVKKAEAAEHRASLKKRSS